MSTTSTATQLQAPELAWFRGDARLYRLDPPVHLDRDPDDDDDQVSPPVATHVIVSATVVPFSGPETYIFPAAQVNGRWEVSDWGELDGSFRGGLDHRQALGGLGYRKVVSL